MIQYTDGFSNNHRKRFDTKAEAIAYFRKLDQAGQAWVIRTGDDEELDT